MFEEVIAELQKRGIASFIQKPGQLVIAASVPNFPGSDSFWVTRFRRDWYLATWAPRVYRVTPGQDICDVCAAVLKSSEAAIYRVDQSLVSQFKLEELPEERMDTLMKELFDLSNSEE